ncbi:hypothetical protein FQR65_LT19818 [Abscondita terminalis]|nr:hypothetical protein FQR65_LT19818 [Abscondita terminalis]
MEFPVFQQIRICSHFCIFAIDLPSELLADCAMEQNYPCLKADHVFTLEIPRTGLLLPDSKKFLNDFSAINIDPKELQQSGMECFDLQSEIAQQYEINILIKDAYTLSVLSDGNCYFNSSGKWKIPTESSGNTLSGILTSLLGQGYQPQEACILGVHLHGLAEDLVAVKIHPTVMISF